MCAMRTASTVLCSCYAMSGTALRDVRYRPARCPVLPYAMSGTALRGSPVRHRMQTVPAPPGSSIAYVSTGHRRAKPKAHCRAAVTSTAFSLALLAFDGAWYQHAVLRSVLASRAWYWAQYLPFVLGHSSIQYAPGHLAASHMLRVGA
eukprot:3401046-Rhodomonas_salina.1